MTRFIFKPCALSQIAELRRDYLDQQPVPLDGMWQTFVEMSEIYAIEPASSDTAASDTAKGYCAINAEGMLLQFYLKPEYDDKQAFAQLRAQVAIGGAVLATSEHRAMALSLDPSIAVTVNALMYAKTPGKPNDARSDVDFRALEPSELSTAVDFGVNALGAPAGWLEGYYGGLIARCELFGLRQGGALVALGECRPSALQSRYADVGMVVAPAYRRRGLASETLRLLLDQCARLGLDAICSTEIGNVAAQRAITTSGFLPHGRMVEIVFEPPQT